MVVTSTLEKMDLKEQHSWGQRASPPAAVTHFPSPGRSPYLGFHFRGEQGWRAGIVLSPLHKARDDRPERKCLLIFSSIFFCCIWHARFQRCFRGVFFGWYFWFKSLCCICHREVSPPQIVWKVKPGGKCTYYH